jgi:thiamine pyrophosphokinase
MLKTLDFSLFRSILCLDGDLPPAQFFPTQLPVIAADGAANQLVRMGIHPSLVIGDLDSLDPRLRKSLDCLWVEDQDYCDFEKAQNYISQNSLSPTLILGVNGGVLDHVTNNLNLLVKGMRREDRFYAPPILGLVMRSGESKQLSYPVETKISILGIPEACLTTQGFRWELRNQHLSFPGNTSCFNRLSHNPSLVNVKSGTALVMIHRAKA